MSDLIEIKAKNYLPASLSAERTILGAILLDNTAFNEAAGTISADDFSSDTHRVIFRSMSALIEAGRTVDAVTLVEDLTRVRTGSFDPGYIADLFAGMPDRPSIEHYIAIVKEKAQLRGLISAATTAIERIISGGEQPREIAAGLLDAVLHVEAQSAKASAVQPKEFIVEVVSELQQQAESQGLIGLSTGLAPLDAAIGGLRKGELVVVGARPGAGKTALAAQIAEACGVDKRPAGMFSLEMSRWDIGRRFLSMRTNVAAFKIRDPHFIAKTDWPALREGAAETTGWPLYIDDSGSLTIAELIARAKLLIHRSKAELIIVDYLQLVRAPIAETRDRVSYVTDQLRILAKAERVPVVLLSQLRRPVSVNDEPTLVELKESGDIEAHAHIVLLIHSPVGSEGLPTGEQKIIIAKNRNGLRGRLAVTLSDAKLKFYPTLQV